MIGDCGLAIEGLTTKGTKITKAALSLAKAQRGLMEGWKDRRCDGRKACGVARRYAKIDYNRNPIFCTDQ